MAGLEDSAIAEGGGKLFMALALQKLLWPLRLAITGICVPIVAALMPQKSSNDEKVEGNKTD